MAQIFRNNAFSVLASGVTDSATSMTLTDASGFPAPTGGDFALATLVGFGSNGAENAWEIVKITARASNTLTVVRGQEGTTAVAWGAATQVQMRLTAGGLATKEDLITAGTTAEYRRGDKTWRDFATDVRAAVLTGLSTASSAVVTATDTVLAAIGQLQAQITLRAPIASPTFTGTVGGITKGMVGLGNVDNTSDANKPVSTATQTALDAKQATLVSGTNIKTVNGQALPGSGNISILGGPTVDDTAPSSPAAGQEWVDASGVKWTRVVDASGDAYWVELGPFGTPLLKTINGSSIIGTGDLAIATGGVVTRETRTSNSALVQADDKKLIEITSGSFTQTFGTRTAGWSCYYSNTGTGDIDITTDGVSYKMYTGEKRWLVYDGTNTYSIVVNAFNKVYTSSATFTVPPGYTRMAGYQWAAGGSGGKSGNSFTTGGGGGGACVPFDFPVSVLGSTVSLTIGAGGAAVTAAGNGNAGGNTSFGSLSIAYGGGAGGADVGGGRTGGSGGGSLDAGVAGSSSAVRGGHPSITDMTTAGVYANNQGGGGGAGTTNASGRSVFGGGGGCSTAPGGNSVYGGGGGGGGGGSAGSVAGGTSTMGGNGGAGNDSTSGVDGSVRGGGGGGTRTGTQSGAGGRGEIQVWGVM